MKDGSRAGIEGLPASTREMSAEVRGAVPAGIHGGGEGEGMPARIGRYRIVARLGAGSTGQVYRAVDEQQGHEVAVKVLRSEVSHLMQRFKHEARAQARIENDHICRIQDVGEADGKAYITMQLINGQSLKRLVKQLTLEQKVEVVRQIALALDAAHALGVIHRDVKPANIMVERDHGRLNACLVDFGIARVAEAPGITGTGRIFGTPAFMAPEQLSNPAGVDHRADLYALGATLYAVLAGRPPFTGSTPVEIMVQALSSRPAAMQASVPAIPAALRSIIAKCMAASPQSRYASAGELAAALQHFLDAKPSSNEPGTRSAMSE